MSAIVVHTVFPVACLLVDTQTEVGGLTWSGGAWQVYSPGEAVGDDAIFVDTGVSDGVLTARPSEVIWH